jgi:hypothetical protein
VHYSPLHDATVIPSARREDGGLVFWTAERDVDQAMAAGLGDQSTAIEAVVNHGRWLVICPDCRGAQLATPTDHRFMCCNCGNTAVDGLWRPVAWPDEAETIAFRLHERDVNWLQNWSPGETAADLDAENELLRWLDSTEPVDPRKWEGHTHRWSRADRYGVRTCKDHCGLALDTNLIAGVA